MLGLGLPACTIEEDTPPDPLATTSGFCDAWAEAACRPKVITYCNAKSTDACQSTQGDFCRSLVPSSYSSAHAQECLDAVRIAYEDAELTPEEVQVVLHLAAPCDQLSKGTRTSGQSCSANEECNTAGGFACIVKQGASEGECGQPELISAGEACDGANQICKEGYFCSTEEYCVAYKRTGGACEGDYQCKPTDHCVKDSADAETGICELRADLGDPCTVDADCQSGYCAAGTSATESQCAATIRLGLREPLCESLR